MPPLDKGSASCYAEGDNFPFAERNGVYEEKNESGRPCRLAAGEQMDLRGAGGGLVLLMAGRLLAAPARVEPMSRRTGRTMSPP